MRHFSRGWRTSRDSNISAAQIPDKDNFEADTNSRKFQDAPEWQLNPKMYKAVCDTFGTPEIDLLTIRINRQSFCSSCLFYKFESTFHGFISSI